MAASVGQHADGQQCLRCRTLVATALLLGAASTIDVPSLDLLSPQRGDCSAPSRADDVAAPFSLALLQRESQQRPVSALALHDGERLGGQSAAGTNMTLSVSTSLDEKGHKQVANYKSDVQMRIFIRRVLGQLGLNISDEEEFRRVVPYYSGAKSVQSYAALIEELSDAERSGHWLKPADEHPGSSVALTEDGYHRVAMMKSDEEMEKFIRRLVNSMSLKVIKDDGLEGVVPWYSGTQNTQDLAKLHDEIVRAVNVRSWVATDPRLM